MDPNQQNTPYTPAPGPQSTPPPVPQQPAYGTPEAPQQQAAQPPYQQQPVTPVDPTPVTALPQPTPLPAPQAPTSYDTNPSTAAYDPNYLDSIAPPPPRASFFSGSFGKIFFALLGVFVFAVSIIIAFSGKDNTADLQQIAVRTTNFSLVVKAQQPYLTSNNLSNTSTNFKTWLSAAQSDSTSLLKLGGVQKAQYNKTMTASEKKLTDGLTDKFEDARLNAVLNRVYASSMAIETQKMVNLLNSMAKKSASAKIRDYAKNASKNLVPIQAAFDKYVDDGN